MTMIYTPTSSQYSIFFSAELDGLERTIV